MEHWPAYEAKMKGEGLSDAAINAFKYNFEKLTSGESLFIPESSITAVDSLPTYESLTKEDPSLLGSTVMLKLNGGLGTGMGLEKAKSLLKVRGNDTFLDFIAKQVLHMRKEYGVSMPFMLMNSFSTSADTLKALNPYKDEPGFVGLFSKYCIAQITAIIAAWVSYPFDTVRRRLQMQAEKPKEEHLYSGSMDCALKICKEEGVDALFKGFAANVLRTLGGAIVLVGYDEIKKLIG